MTSWLNIRVLVDTSHVMDFELQILRKGPSVMCSTLLAIVNFQGQENDHEEKQGTLGR